MWYCVPSLYFGLRQNYGKSNGSNGDLFQKTYASTMWLPGLLKSVPLTLQHATVEPCFHQRLPDTHRQVSCGVTVPFSWVWYTRFYSALQEYISQFYISSGRSLVGLMVTSSKRTYAIPKSKAPVSAAFHCDPYLHRRCSNTVLSQSLWGPWVLVCTRFV